MTYILDLNEDRTKEGRIILRLSNKNKRMGGNRANTRIRGSYSIEWTIEQKFDRTKL